MPNVTELLAEMDYGPAPESVAAAQAWIVAAGRLGGKGAQVALISPATGAAWAEVGLADAGEISAALARARAAQPGWAGLAAPARAEALRRAALALGAQRRLLTELETLGSGRALREIARVDLPAAEAALQRAARRAEAGAALAPRGALCATLASAAPLLSLVETLAETLTAGETLVALCPPEAAPAALALAQTLENAGPPEGVLAVLPVSGAPACPADAQLAAPAGAARPALIVLADADLDAAVEGIARAVWSGLGQLPTAFGRVLVAEAVAEALTARLTRRLATLRLGDPLDGTTDLGPLRSSAALEALHAGLHAAVTAGATLIEAEAAPTPSEGAYARPALLTGVAPANPAFGRPLLGPVATLTTFRTPTEAIELANNLAEGRAVSIWSESVTTVLDLATRVAARQVFINEVGLVGLAAEEIRAPETAGQDLRAALAAAQKAASWSALSGAERAAQLRGFGAAALAEAPSGAAEIRAKGRMEIELRAPLGVLALEAASLDQALAAVALGNRVIWATGAPEAREAAARLPAGVLTLVPEGAPGLGAAAEIAACLRLAPGLAGAELARALTRARRITLPFGA